MIREYYASQATCCGQGETFSLGSGDVIAAAALRPGEHVLDLGSGTGHDALRAVALVGPGGRVDGVDFTPQMLERARAAASGHVNVAFHEGDIARLPFADESYDAVMTNCVVNLASDKRGVFAEARRVLRPGGRFVISDIVFASAPDARVRRDDALVCGCVGGAALLDEYLVWLREAGFGEARILERRPYGRFGDADALAVTLVATD